jgi:hypothetical protein
MGRSFENRVFKSFFSNQFSLRFQMRPPTPSLREQKPQAPNFGGKDAPAPKFGGEYGRFDLNRGVQTLVQMVFRAGFK